MKLWRKLYKNKLYRRRQRQQQLLIRSRPTQNEYENVSFYYLICVVKVRRKPQIKYKIDHHRPNRSTFAVSYEFMNHIAGIHSHAVRICEIYCIRSRKMKQKTVRRMCFFFLSFSFDFIWLSGTKVKRPLCRSNSTKKNPRK